MDYRKIIMDYVKSHDLKKMELGKHMIDDVNFLKISEYDTKEENNGKFEKHLKYIDGFYIVSGEEKVLVSKEFNEVISDYNDEKDVAFFKCYNFEEKIIKEGDLLILDTDEYHNPGIAIKNSIKVRKAIFKIKK